MFSRNMEIYSTTEEDAIHFYHFIMAQKWW